LFSFLFPAQYAFDSQAALRGYDPSTTIRKVSPRPGEYALREEDIIDVIEREGDTIALVLFSGVQYYTGQLFPIETITQKAHEKVRFICFR
jgi:kynureninase